MRKIVALILTTTFLISFSLPVCADEGMWTFDNPPRRQWKERYNFDPSDAWLDHLRLSSVRVGTSSGAFVSPDGLVLTNQHVASSQIAKLSSKERDLAREG